MEFLKLRLVDSLQRLKLSFCVKLLKFFVLPFLCWCRSIFFEIFLGSSSGPDFYLHGYLCCAMSEVKVRSSSSWMSTLREGHTAYSSKMVSGQFLFVATICTYRLGGGYIF